MSDIYAIKEDGSAQALKKVRCKSEDAELQTLLENNLDLLPGDQISPESPRRWLLIKREMPVPDPTTGTNRWSIDFFLADQDAIPTFVECKRHDDSRARREVVGQMLDYVANGHHYWTALEIMELARQTASKRSQTVESAIASLGPMSYESVDAYFKHIEANLREGNVRMVFLLEDSSYELRSVVEFLQNQMQRADVLLVEIHQYEVNGQRIVAPTLFGYTEQARLAKREATRVRSASGRRVWNQDSFVENAITKLTTDQVESIRQILEVAEKSGWAIRWGTGTENGSMSILMPAIAKRSLFTIYSNGVLTLNFGWLYENQTEEKARDAMAEFAAREFGLAIPDNYKEKYLSVPPSDWAPKVATFINFLHRVSAGI